jgi:hypothetical protein
VDGSQPGDAPASLADGSPPADGDQQRRVPIPKQHIKKKYWATFHDRLSDEASVRPGEGEPDDTLVALPEDVFEVVHADSEEDSECTDTEPLASAGLTKLNVKLMVSGFLGFLTVLGFQ